MIDPLQGLCLKRQTHTYIHTQGNRRRWCTSRIQTDDTCVQAIEDSIRFQLRGSCSGGLIFCPSYFRKPTGSIPKWLNLGLERFAMISSDCNVLICYILVSSRLAMQVDSSSSTCDLYFGSSTSNLGWGTYDPG